LQYEKVQKLTADAKFGLYLCCLCSVELAEDTVRVINFSFRSGRVPEQWLHAVVTPVPKISQPLQLADFRPVSVTPILSRIAEKLIVTKWLRSAIPPESIADQFAFKLTRSTTCGIVYLMHHITLLLEDNGYVRCLVVDFLRHLMLLAIRFLFINLHLSCKI